MHEPLERASQGEEYRLCGVLLALSSYITVHDAAAMFRRFRRSRGGGAGIHQLPISLRELLQDADTDYGNAHLRLAFRCLQHQHGSIHRTRGGDMGPRVDPFEWFAGLTIVSEGGVEDKVALLYEVFDVRGTEDLGLLFWAVKSVLSRCGLIDKPDSRYLLHDVYGAFALESGKLRETISEDALLRWIKRAGTAGHRIERLVSVLKRLPSIIRGLCTRAEKAGVKDAMYPSLSDGPQNFGNGEMQEPVQMHGGPLVLLAPGTVRVALMPAAKCLLLSQDGGVAALTTQEHDVPAEQWTLIEYPHQPGHQRKAGERFTIAHKGVSSPAAIILSLATASCCLPSSEPGTRQDFLISGVWHGGAMNSVVKRVGLPREDDSLSHDLWQVLEQRHGLAGAGGPRSILVHFGHGQAPQAVERCLLLLRSTLRVVKTPDLVKDGLSDRDMTLPRDLRLLLAEQLRAAYIQYVLPPPPIAQRFCHVFYGAVDPLLGFPLQRAHEAFPREIQYLLPLLQQVSQDLIGPLHMLDGQGGQSTIDHGPITVAYLKQATYNGQEGEIMVSDLRADLPNPSARCSILLLLCESPWLLRSGNSPAGAESRPVPPVASADGATSSPSGDGSQPSVAASSLGLSSMALLAEAHRDGHDMGSTLRPSLVPPEDEEPLDEEGVQECSSDELIVNQGIAESPKEESGTLQGQGDKVFVAAGGQQFMCEERREEGSYIQTSELLAALFEWKARARHEAEGAVPVEVIIMTAGEPQGTRATVLDVLTGSSLPYVSVGSTIPTDTVKASVPQEIMACLEKDGRYQILQDEVLDGSYAEIRVGGPSTEAVRPCLISTGTAAPLLGPAHDVQLLLGPFLKDLWATGVIIMAEFSQSSVVTCLVRDMLIGKDHSLRQHVCARRPTSFVFSELQSDRPYTVAFDVMLEQRHCGAFRTPISLSQPSLLTMALVPVVDMIPAPSHGSSEHTLHRHQKGRVEDSLSATSEETSASVWQTIGAEGDSLPPRNHFCLLLGALPVPKDLVCAAQSALSSLYHAGGTGHDEQTWSTLHTLEEAFRSHLSSMLATQGLAQVAASVPVIFLDGTMAFRAADLIPVYLQGITASHVLAEQMVSHLQRVACEYLGGSKQRHAGSDNPGRGAPWQGVAGICRDMRLGNLEDNVSLLILKLAPAGDGGVVKIESRVWAWLFQSMDDEQEGPTDTEGRPRTIILLTDVALRPRGRQRTEGGSEGVACMDVDDALRLVSLMLTWKSAVLGREVVLLSVSDVADATPGTLSIMRVRDSARDITALYLKYADNGRGGCGRGGGHEFSLGDGRFVLECVGADQAAVAPAYVRLEVALQDSSSAADARIVRTAGEAKADGRPLALSLGPVIGEVTSTSALILVEVPCTAMLTCTLRPLRVADRSHTQSRRAGPAAPVVFSFTSLSPGSTYVLSVEEPGDHPVVLASSWLRTMSIQLQVFKLLAIPGEHLTVAPSAFVRNQEPKREGTGARNEPHVPLCRSKRVVQGAGPAEGSTGVWAHILEQHRFPLRGYDMALWIGGPAIGEAIGMAVMEEALGCQKLGEGAGGLADACTYDSAQQSDGTQALLSDILHLPKDDQGSGVQATLSNGAATEVLRRFKDHYRACLTHPDVRKLLSTLPSLMIDSVFSSASFRTLIEASRGLPMQHQLSSTSLQQAAIRARQEYMAQAPSSSTYQDTPLRSLGRVHGALAMVTLQPTYSLGTQYGTCREAERLRCNLGEDQLEGLGSFLQQLSKGVRAVIVSCEIPIVPVVGSLETPSLPGTDAVEVLRQVFYWMGGDKPGCRVALLLCGATATASDVHVVDVQSQMTLRQLCLRSNGEARSEASTAGSQPTLRVSPIFSERFRLKEVLGLELAVTPCFAEVTLRLESDSVELHALLMYENSSSKPHSCSLILGPIIGKVDAIGSPVQVPSVRILVETDIAAPLKCVLTDTITREQLTHAITTTARKPATFHLQELTPGRRYMVEILGAVNGAARVCSFSVPEPQSSTVNLAVVSADHPDVWAGPDMWQPLIERLEGPYCDIDLVIHAGGQVSMAQALLEAMHYLHGIAGPSAAAVHEAQALVLERFREEYKRAWDQPSKRRLWKTGSRHLMLGSSAGDVGWGVELGLLPTSRLRTTPEGVVALALLRQVAQEYQSQLGHLDLSLSTPQEAATPSHLLAGGRVGVFFLDIREDLRTQPRSPSTQGGAQQESQWLSRKQKGALSHLLQTPGVCAVVVVSELPIIFRPQDDEQKEDMQETLLLEHWHEHPVELLDLVTMLANWKAQGTGIRDVIVVNGTGGGISCGLETIVTFPAVGQGGLDVTLLSLTSGPICDRPGCDISLCAEGSDSNICHQHLRVIEKANYALVEIKLEKSSGEIEDSGTITGRLLSDAMDVSEPAMPMWLRRRLGNFPYMWFDDELYLRLAEDDAFKTLYQATYREENFLEVARRAYAGLVETIEMGGPWTCVQVRDSIVHCVSSLRAARQLPDLADACIQWFVYARAATCLTLENRGPASDEWWYALREIIKDLYLLRRVAEQWEDE